MTAEGTTIGNGIMYVGDCLDVMKTFPDCHVSATVTSPLMLLSSQVIAKAQPTT